MQKILKIRFDKVTLEEAKNQALEWSKGLEQRQICTPNPEMILEAQKNNKFLKVLNHSALNIADGIGILWAAKYLSVSHQSKSKIIKTIKWLYSIFSIALRPSYIRSELTERVTGSDLMKSIAKASPDHQLKIFLLGAKEGIALKVKEKLSQEYSGIKITGVHSGSPKEKEETEILKRIRESEAQILFVAFGAPSQELWINRNLKKIPNIKVAIGVGGSFDFIAGTKKRAPKWMQKTGLEWLYRLGQEPSRIKRIYKATVKFPMLILRKSLKS